MQKPNRSSMVSKAALTTALSGLGATLHINRNPAMDIISEWSRLIPALNNRVGSYNRLSQKGRRRRARQRNSC